MFIGSSWESCHPVLILLFAFLAALRDIFLSNKSFFEAAKKHRHSQTIKNPLFIDRKAVFFTKIHEEEKCCQAYHSLGKANYFLIRWQQN
jgi:hypothetical protein